MTMERWRFWGLAAAMLACGLGRAGAADWPQWGGSAGRIMASPEKSLPHTFLPGKKKAGTAIDLSTTKYVKWIAPARLRNLRHPRRGRRQGVHRHQRLRDRATPSFRTDDGGVFRCLDESTGKLLWQLVVPCTNRHGNRNWLFDNMGLGICAAPAVDGDRVYVVTNRCEVVCLDVNGMANGNQGMQDEGKFQVPEGTPPVKIGPTDGDILWRFDMVSQLPCQPHDAASSSVLVVGDLVYAGTSNGVAKGGVTVTYPLAPSLIALDKRTGRLAAVDNEKIGTRLFHGQWSSPSCGEVAGRKLIFFGAGDGICYAFEHPTELHDGPPVPLKKVWSYDCDPPEFRNLNGKPRDYWAGDVREHRGNTGDGTYAGPCEIIATPAFYKNRVYVAIGQDPRHGRGRGILHCIDATRTGDITTCGTIWTYDKLDRSMSTVSIAYGLLFIADYSGKIHCLDAETGSCCWVHDTGAEIWGSTLVADHKLYVGTQKSLVILAAERQDKLLGDVRLGSPIWASPIAANGTLYVASQKYLWAVSKQAAAP